MSALRPKAAGLSSTDVSAMGQEQTPHTRRTDPKKNSGWGAEVSGTRSAPAQTIPTGDTAKAELASAEYGILSRLRSEWSQAHSNS
jgi:hypothetical protein